MSDELASLTHFLDEQRETFRRKVGGKFLNGQLLAIALISKDDLCALADEGLGDGEGETPAVGDAKDESSLAREELRHELLIVARGGRSASCLQRCLLNNMASR